MCKNCSNPNYDANKDPAYDCRDCGVNTNAIDEYYMVNDEIWTEFGMKKDMLCISCLEKRIGRRLKSDDFPDMPINRGVFPYSSRLLNRLID